VNNLKQSYIKYELKKWIRDPMVAFLLIYPVILALAVRFGVPFAENKFGFPLTSYNHIIIGALLLFTTVLTGTVIAFSILDDRDDKILYAVDVSPVSFDTFIGLRFFMCFILTYISCILAIWIAGIAVPLYAMLLISISISLFSSLSAMFINCFSNNKIEGFAVMKGGGSIIIFPIVAMFFTDKKEFFFGFEPNFWTVKALGVAMQPNMDFNLSFGLYYTIGLVFVIALNFLIYKTFKRKILA